MMYDVPRQHWADNQLTAIICHSCATLNKLLKCYVCAKHSVTDLVEFHNWVMRVRVVTVLKAPSPTKLEFHLPFNIFVND